MSLYFDVIFPQFFLLIYHFLHFLVVDCCTVNVFPLIYVFVLADFHIFVHFFSLCLFALFSLYT